MNSGVALAVDSSGGFMAGYSRWFGCGFVACVGMLSGCSQAPLPRTALNVEKGTEIWVNADGYWRPEKAPLVLPEGRWTLALRRRAGGKVFFTGGEACPHLSVVGGADLEKREVRLQPKWCESADAPLALHTAKGGVAVLSDTAMTGTQQTTGGPSFARLVEQSWRFELNESTPNSMDFSMESAAFYGDQPGGFHWPFGFSSEALGGVVVVDQSYLCQKSDETEEQWQRTMTAYLTDLPVNYGEKRLVVTPFFSLESSISETVPTQAFGGLSRTCGDIRKLVKTCSGRWRDASEANAMLAEVLRGSERLVFAEDLYKNLQETEFLAIDCQHLGVRGHQEVARRLRETLSGLQGTEEGEGLLALSLRNVE